MNGVVALLAALVLPAVSSARESVRRTQCLSNLSEIGKASGAFVDARGSFPAGDLRHSVLWTLAPWLGEDSLVDRLNTDFPVFNQANQTHFSRRIALYVCPTDSAGGLTLQGTTGCSYAGNAGTGLVWHGYDGIVVPASVRSRVSPRDVADGLSRTAAFAEQGIADGASRISARTIWNTTFVLQSAGDEREFQTRCQGMPLHSLGGPNLFLRGRYWQVDLPGGAVYNHLIPPGKPSCANGVDLEKGALTSDSLHADVVNCLYADGRAEAVSKSINDRVWAAKGSRSGGEAQ